MLLAPDEIFNFLVYCVEASAVFQLSLLCEKSNIHLIAKLNQKKWVQDSKGVISFEFSIMPSILAGRS